jgi:hypothetical protein
VEPIRYGKVQPNMANRPTDSSMTGVSVGVVKKRPAPIRESNLVLALNMESQKDLRGLTHLFECHAPFGGI